MAQGSPKRLEKEDGSNLNIVGLFDTLTRRSLTNKELIHAAKPHKAGGAQPPCGSRGFRPPVAPPPWRIRFAD
jgi:hypothetical protein